MKQIGSKTNTNCYIPGIEVFSLKMFRSKLLLFLLIISLAAVFLNVDKTGYFPVRNSCAKEDCFVTPSGVVSEIASDESMGISPVRETISRNNFARKISPSRSALLYFLVFSALAIIAFSSYFRSFFIETILFSRLFIITYIHNLDGMKA